MRIVSYASWIAAIDILGMVFFKMLPVQVAARSVASAPTLIIVLAILGEYAGSNFCDAAMLATT